MDTKIAVIATREHYKHLCRHCHLTPVNHTFQHVPTRDHAVGQEFSGYLLVGDLGRVQALDELEELVRTRVREAGNG